MDFEINTDLCKKDGVCAAICPMGIIGTYGKNTVPFPIDDFDKKCIKCGHCVAACPTEAISVSGILPSDCSPLLKELALTKEHTEHFLRSRRSIRNYQNKQPDRKVIEALIGVARYAQTGENSQLVKWLVFDERERIKAINAHVVDWMKMLIDAKHPAAEKFDMPLMVKAMLRGNDVISRGAPCLIFACAPKEYPLAQVDTTIALTFLDLAAPSFGLGTCWAGFIMICENHYPPLREYLSLPEGYGQYGAIMLGYPQFKYRRLPPRKEPSIIWK